MAANNRDPIIVDALRRFPNLGNRTIARYIIDTVGDKYNNDLEKVRSKIRQLRGANGSEARIKSQNSQEFWGQGKAEMPVTWRKTRTPYQLGAGLWLFLADVHVPFHEPKAVEAAMAFGKKNKVSGVFINGDFMDCAAASFWATKRRDFNKEVEASLDLLDLLRGEFKGKPIVYKPGNHEYRLPAYFVSHAPDLAASPLACMETVMGFEERNIEFLDYHQLVFAGDLPVLHGHEVRNINRAVNPARGLFLRTKTFSLCGHCHSTSEHSPRNILGKLLTTWSIGCLCDLSPDYCPYGNDWNHGVAIVSVEKNGNFEVEYRRILESGRVV